MAVSHAHPLETAISALVGGYHRDPFSLLGPHAEDGVPVVRAFYPAAERVDLRLVSSGAIRAMEKRDAAGLYEARVDEPRPDYRLRITYPGGQVVELDDPYRYGQVLTDFDLHLLGEGTHHRMFDKLGSHCIDFGGTRGVHFAVWAPNAERVSVVGDFNGWDGRVTPMRLLVPGGIWEMFIPNLREGEKYKYEIRAKDGSILKKTDPFGLAFEVPPQSAAIVRDISRYVWGDDEWMRSREAQGAWMDRPMTIYEAHLGSWARVPEDGERFLSYRELADRLVSYVKGLGFTHIELLPVMEHPYSGSWGYQVTGYYAPTSRYGSPDDFRFFVDTLHEAGIGVFLDWVPAHFPKDDYALRRFDGTALYEHEDPRLGEHPDWGTLIFNYGRKEVRNYLVANALYWLHEFHVDGLRVDAVASMLYLDYSRKAGEWVPNKYGGRENLEAIDFLREMNHVVGEDAPGCVTIAEDSTAWPGVTRPIREGGLGFTFKWNMGWMHDTLGYFQPGPIHRRYHQGELTFAMVYENSENFIMPLSHDEMVHLKGSLYGKMPGDHWQKMANLRALYAYQFTRPGKSLLFMGSELAPPDEWDHDHSLPWHLLEDPSRAAMRDYVTQLARVYHLLPALWQRDPDPHSFEWIDTGDDAHSVLSFIRRSHDS